MHCLLLLFQSIFLKRDNNNQHLKLATQRKFPHFSRLFFVMKNKSNRKKTNLSRAIQTIPLFSATKPFQSNPFSSLNATTEYKDYLFLFQLHKRFLEKNHRTVENHFVSSHAFKSYYLEENNKNCHFFPRHK